VAIADTRRELGSNFAPQGRVECSLFYSDVYKLCVCKPKAFQEPLYKHLEEFFRNHVRHLLKACGSVLL
jgi:hypothetical protein